MSSDLPAGGRAVQELSHAELEVAGMTCRSCAARIENTLNRLDGVVASVNFATETATVAYDPDRADVDHLVAAVAATGYTARLRRRAVAHAGGAPITPTGAGHGGDQARVLWRRRRSRAASQ